MSRSDDTIRTRVLGAINELPPLNEVAQHLIRLMGSDSTSAADLDRMIRNDQALTARVLKLANSSVYGKSRSISSLTDAVVLLGHTTLTDMVLSLSVSDIMNGSDLPGFGEAAWKHSVDCAATARALATLTGAAEPEVAFVTGLMHDIGLLVMASAAPQELSTVLAERPTDPLALERKRMGLNHPQVGRRLVNQWKLPVAICEAIRFHHAPGRKYARSNPLVNLVALADLLTAIHGATIYPCESGTDLFALLKTCGIQLEHFPALFLKIKECRDTAHELQASIDGQGRREHDAESADTARLFSVYAGDQLRAAWHEAVLAHLGHGVVPWADLRSGCGAEVEWVIVDLHGMAPDARDLLGRRASEGLPELAVIEGTTKSPWPGAPLLPPVLTRDVLSSLPARTSEPLA